MGMRITNGILINNSLSNINNNKTTMDRLNTQLTSEKKIQRASDDPIIAIRALRFRSTLSEIDQYLKKNIPDATSWLETTDEAMSNIVGIIGDITTYCNQAVNGYYDTTDKNTIVETLKAYRDQIYCDANTDCAGRTIFTGYKTDGTLTFKEDNESKFKITQKFNADNLDIIYKVNNGLDVSGINDATIGGTNISGYKLPEQVKVYRLRLGYDALEDGAVLKLNDGTQITTVDKTSKDAGAYSPGADEAYFLADTGEIILGKNVYDKLYAADKNGDGVAFSVTYEKHKFSKGELDPSQYFDCVDMTETDPDKWITYTSRDQNIDYEINFNQTLSINIQGKKVYNQDMTRDIDDIINTVNFALNTENKKSKIENLYNNAVDGSTEKKKYKELLDLCERELDFAKDNMKKAFSTGLGKYTKHQDTVSLARSEVGARLKRLELNESRLESQEKTVENLKSINEDVNLTEVAIELKEARSIYDASLAAASNVVRKKLLDFL